jgi:hypothetical protein
MTRPPFIERRTEVPPFVIDGVEFASWHVGICQYQSRSTDGRIVAWLPPGSCGYRASVDGVTLRDKRGRLRGFTDRRSAIKAGIKALPSVQP